MENRYSDKEFSEQMVTSGKHRQFVGGMWHELGELQYEYLCAKGLKPHDKLLDVGCGSLRGGVKFISFLNAFNYYGFDLNLALIEAGLKIELPKLGLDNKVSIENFAAAPDFEYPEEWVNFDAVIAISLMTHLNFNSICQCLHNTSAIMKKGSRFYTTVFLAPKDVYQRFEQSKGIFTNPNADPFHYTYADMEYAAKRAGLALIAIEDFSHPRNQQMAIFEKS